MSFVIDHCYLIVRTAGADGGPSLQGTWTSTPLHNGWYSLERTSDGERVVAWRANSSGADVLYAVFGRLATLAAIAAASTLGAPATTAWNAAVAGNATARAVMRRWPIWIMDGSVRLPSGTPSGGTTALVAVTGATVKLFPEGGTLPTVPISFPVRYDATGAQVGTDGAATVRVDAITRPSLSLTLMGYSLDDTLRDES